MSCKLTLCHTFVTNVALFNCVDISNVLLQNICCVELSFTDVTVGLVFLVVFSVVLVETKSTDEFFSTISTLILNVHGSKSRSQLKRSTIFKTVSTFDCVKSVKGMTKYDLDKESDVALVLLHIWVANHMGYRVGRGKTEFFLTRPLTAGAVE